MQAIYEHWLQRLSGLPGARLWVFGYKQAWSALFGGLMIGAVLLTHIVDLPILSRYDWLFVAALAIQAFMLLAKLERPHELITIVAFHLTGLGMELFKTSESVGSWTYPGYAFFHLGNVPLFSGFMYAAVGSYIARSWRVLELSFIRPPKRVFSGLLALAIYINFFSHHFVYDLRYVLFAATLLLYGRTTVSYKLATRRHRMPLVVGFVLIALFIWLAENIATYTSVWLYPNQIDSWHLVSIHKLGSWALLMIISFIMVDFLHLLRDKRPNHPPRGKGLRQ